METSSSLFIEDFFINDITCSIFRTILTLSDSQHDTVRRAYSGHCNIKLPMAETAITQPDPHIAKSLSLRLVYSHGECYSYWKLSSSPLKWEFVIFRLCCNPRNQDSSSIELPFCNSTLKQIVLKNPVKYKLCSITKT